MTTNSPQSFNATGSETTENVTACQTRVETHDIHELPRSAATLLEIAEKARGLREALKGLCRNRVQP